MGNEGGREQRATEHQLMAIFDWKTPSQPRIHGEKARPKKPHWRAMALLTTERNKNQVTRRLVI
jgi:hypothetical protein